MFMVMLASGPIGKNIDRKTFPGLGQAGQKHPAAIIVKGNVMPFIVPRY
jgi:hypothetical protein